MIPDRQSSWKSAITSTLVRESRLPVGSSARMTLGSLTMARAMATRCCWPPESWFGWWCMRVAEPDALERLGRALSSLHASRRRRTRAAARRSRARVVRASRLNCWNTKPRTWLRIVGELAAAHARDAPARRARRCRSSGGRGSRGCSSASTSRARRAHDRDELAAPRRGARRRRARAARRRRSGRPWRRPSSSMSGSARPSEEPSHGGRRRRRGGAAAVRAASRR